MAIGRPIEFDPDIALEAATRSFWANGYEGTSLQDLLKATKLSKSSLYQTFGGKQELFGRCIEAYTGKMVSMLSERYAVSKSPLDFLKGILGEIASEGVSDKSPKGCFIMNTASEFGRRDEIFSGWVDHGIRKVRKVLLDAVANGQRLGEISKARSADALADYLMTAIAGLRTMVKAGAGSKELLVVVDVTVGTLKGG